MNRSPAFSFYPDKWQSHTRRLSDSAYRVYHEMVCWMWQQSEDYCSILASPDAVACAVAMPTECVRTALAEIQNPFSPLLKEENGKWICNGLRKEALKQCERSHKAKSSANARWREANASDKQFLDNPDNPRSDKNILPAMRTECERNANASKNCANVSKDDAKASFEQCFPSPSPSPSPLDNNISSNDLKLEGESPPIDHFQEFWTKYPRKESKADALKAWNQIKGNQNATEILSGLAKFQFADDQQFRPLPATWLRKRRWEDETPTTATQPDQWQTIAPKASQTLPEPLGDWRTVHIEEWGNCSHAAEQWPWDNLPVAVQRNIIENIKEREESAA